MPDAVRFAGPGLALDVPDDPADSTSTLPDDVSELPDGEASVFPSGVWTEVPGIPLEVRDDPATADSTVGTESVLVSVSPAEQAEAGALVVSLQVRTTGTGRETDGAIPTDTDGQVEMRFSYSDFRYVFAGDWGSRLQVQAFPACFLTTPEDPGCSQGSLVPSVNDPATETVTFTGDVAATVDLSSPTDSPTPTGTPTDTPTDAPADAPTETPTVVPSDSPTDVATDTPTESPTSGPTEDLATVPSEGGSSTGAVYVMSASASGGDGGNYAATPLPTSGGWQVGEASGDFQYAYPFELPAPAVGGSTPSLGLAYSSGSVDGRTRAKNGQASMAGLGWELDSGYIAREYAACSDDGETNTGDLCWKTSNGTLVERLSLVLNGHSSPLVQVGSSNTFRVQDDPAWQVTRIFGDPGTSTDPSNTDNDEEAFRVRTPDGTEYWFGWGHGANSTLTVPVFGNNGSEPCHESTLGASWCQQAWRWNLDKVVDRHGNRTDYQYERETNYYGRMADASKQTVYDANGYLTGITYGYSRSGTSGAYSKVSLTTRPRCTTALTSDTATCTGSNGPTQNPDLWPDSPSNLICGASTSCTNFSPSFFSLLRYDKVTTRRWSGQSWDADSYQMTFRLPQPGDPDGAGIQDLWLESVQRTGKSGPVDAPLPAVNFDGDWLRNRVVTPEGEHPFYKLRIHSILTETGGRIDVEYGHAQDRECTGGYVNDLQEWGSNRECFRQKFGDDWEWWHKYVVTRIGLSDDALGYRLGQSADSSPNLGRLRVYEYDYNGAPGWRYVKNPLTNAGDETWDDWRGYETVIVRTRQVGPNQVPDSSGADLVRRKVVVYRGLDGTPSNNSGGTISAQVDGADYPQPEPDHVSLAGRVAEEVIRDGADNALSRVDTEYGHFATAVNPWGQNAYFVYPQKTYSTPRVGGSRRVITTTVDDGGTNHRGDLLGALQHSEDDRGTPSNATDDLTTCQTWVADSTTNLRVMSKEVVRQGSCTGTVLRHAEYAYDDLAIGATPTQGDLTQGVNYANASTKVETEATYDLYGRPKTQSAPHYDGQTAQWTTTVYNPGGDAHDLLTSIKVTGPMIDADTPGLTSTTTVSPHRGLPTEVTDPNDQVTTIVRDGLGRPEAVTLPGNTGGTPNVEYNYVNYNPSQLPTQPAKIVTRLLRNYPATGGATVDNTTTYLDGWGRTVETFHRNQNTNGYLVSATAYDEQGLPWLDMPRVPVSGSTISYITPDEDTVRHYAQSSFDALSRPIWVIDKSFTTENWITDFDYTATTDTIGKIQHYGASQITRATTTTDLDALGRPAKVHQYGDGTGPSTAGDDGYAEYTYTLTGQLDTIKKPISADPNDLITYNYNYDWLGRRIHSSDPDTGDTSYTYDALGNTIKVDDASPDDTLGWIETSYDVLGRPLLREQVKDNATRATLATWTYDASTLGLGRLTSSTSKTAQGDYTTSVAAYDPRGNAKDTSYTYPGNLTGESLVTTPKTKTYAYTYNQLDQPVTVDYPAAPHLDAISTTTSYGPYGVFDKLTASDGHVIGDATYADDDRPIGLDSRDEAAANADYELRRSYTWTNTDRLDTLTSATGTTPATSVTQLELDYNYDILGNPLRITGTRQDTATSTSTEAAWCYTYDGISRLTTAVTGLPSATSGTTCDTATEAQVSPVTGKLYDLAYTYAQGRLSTVSSGDHTITYSYDDPAHPHAATGLTYNQLLGAPDAGLPSPGTLTYDPAGRVTEWNPAPGGGGATRYTYDAVGNQIDANDTALTGAVDAKNGYDVNGIRVIRVSKGNTVNAGPTEMTKPGALNAAVTRRHFTTPGGTPLAMEVSDGSDAGTEPDWTWLFADAQGNIRLSKRDNSLTSAQQAYYPYGNPIPDVSTLPGERGYLNKTHDPNGELRLDHRSYDPALNILSVPDPLLSPDDPQTLNPYAYARNNPVGFSDPSGLTCLASAGYSCGGSGPIQGLSTTPDPPTPHDPAHVMSLPPSVYYGQSTNNYVPIEGWAEEEPHVSAEVALARRDSFACMGGGDAYDFCSTRDVGMAYKGWSQGSWDAFWAISKVYATTIGPEIAISAAFKGARIGILVREGRAANAGRTGARTCLRSFAGITLVLMADGTKKPIEDIEAGDRVITTDPETGERVTRKVTQVWVHADQVLDLVVDGEVITTTEDHLFWSVTDQRFERADQLAPGHVVLGDGGRELTVSGFRLKTERTARAYNLAVEGIHTYHVGVAAILVHNACFDAQVLSDAGMALDRNGFTAAGRAAQKHGNRPGGFGLPGSRSSAGYNEFGQAMLDDLLTAPNTAMRNYVHQSYGSVTEFLGPQYGARFDSAGNFMGFL